ncbi:oligoribonuclease-like isoform X2 [Panonychus citri]|nr:oligoribonuclease-like isoform X2 [Panonychus citri]
MEMPDETKLHYYETHSDIVWADCEMSGLDIDKDQLLEVAVIITDSNLNEIATLGPLVIKTDPHVLSNMDEWCTRNHTKTGLYQACLESQLTVDQVDQQLYDLLASRNMKLAVLAGNSIAFDKLFLSKFCPKFSSLLHYRTIDVSSFKEVIKRWYPNEVNLKKRNLHRALDDIRDCITELRYYRKKFFRQPFNDNHKNDMSSPNWYRIKETQE